MQANRNKNANDLKEKKGITKTNRLESRTFEKKRKWPSVSRKNTLQFSPRYLHFINKKNIITKKKKKFSFTLLLPLLIVNSERRWAFKNSHEYLKSWKRFHVNTRVSSCVEQPKPFLEIFLSP